MTEPEPLWTPASQARLRTTPARDLATFEEADEALYLHEAPWNRYHASGFPMIFDDPNYRQAWRARRAALVARWEALKPRPPERPRNAALERVSDGR